jgi:uncharacterized protein (TIGR00661 family)
VKILYGACGEGLGHAVRSDVVARHLQSRGHLVRFAVAPGRACDYLVAKWPTTRSVGLEMAISRGKVEPGLTVLHNLARAVLGAPSCVAALASLERPDLVVSDFDPFTAAYAALHGVPLFAVDNVHFLTRCHHPPAFAHADADAERMMRPIVASLVPNAAHYFVTSFAEAPVCAPQTSLHLPIVRPEILAAPRSSGHHVLVYFNDRADARALLEALARLPYAFVVYGMLSAPRTRPERPFPNVVLHPLGPELAAHLASARAVIGGAGFTLMTESIYLGKPLLALPFENQYEQILNANYLAAMGYGERARALDAQTVGSFLARAPAYAERLAHLQHDGNRGLFAALDRAIDSLS